MSERTVEIIDQCIDNIYLEGRESGEATRLEVMRIIANENLSLPPTKQLVAPSLATIYRMINGRDAYERAVARYGEDEANRRFRHSKAGFRATRPNERVEVDHTPLDLPSSTVTLASACFC
ncbi:integrase catalytic subunit [Thauera phenylacetica B4P]|uniref:Integrase catalytic subunit n=2 Tax=Thauera phenylacetica TaxID=164400 RepID=N6Z164_9RHOO|nr:integrase catalytic subunit [Thauera phenylacetica B4P]